MKRNRSMGYGMRDSRLDTLYRYRGVALIVAVPVLLVLIVLAVMPRSTPAGDFGRAHPFSRTGYEAAGGKEAYTIVIDAGSTGSRVHVYKFLSKGPGELELQYDKFDQLKPGLSAYADSPGQAAASLKPLLDLAAATVPRGLQASTPVMVGATAGLRLLPDGKADIILAEVRKWLRGYPFKFVDEDVKILSGVDEGAFAWLTLNYLLGKLGRAEEQTVAAIDLGGGSVQQAYAMTPAEAKAAPDAQYLTTLRGGGRKYQVYVYSYLGYGLMAGRAAVLGVDGSQESHPCVPQGHQGEYEYGGKKLPMAAHPDGSSHDKCVDAVRSALKQDLACGAPQLQCTFNGAWGGTKVPSIFYISSYFWDRAAAAGLVPDVNAIEAVVAPKDFASSAKQACSAKLEDLPSFFPEVEDVLRPFFCLDLAYMHTLLTGGFKIPDDATLTIVKKVEYKGEQIEAAWPLGAAINLLG